MKAKTIVDLGCACEVCKTGSGGCATYPDGRIPIGTVLDGDAEEKWADCWKLVRTGAAEPLDEECEVAADVTERQTHLAQRAARRAAAGIHPEDFEAFDAGMMVGYDGDGNHIPGPNAEISQGGIWLDE